GGRLGAGHAAGAEAAAGADAAGAADGLGGVGAGDRPAGGRGPAGMGPADQRAGGDGGGRPGADRLVRSPVGDRGVSQGAEGGLRGGGAPIRGGAAAATGDRRAVGGGGGAAGPSGRQPHGRRGDPAGAGPVRGGLGPGVELVALPGGPAGAERRRVLPGVGAAGGPAEPKTRPPARLAGPVARVDQTPNHDGSCVPPRGRVDGGKLKAKPWAIPLRPRWG